MNTYKEILVNTYNLVVVDKPNGSFSNAELRKAIAVDLGLSIDESMSLNLASRGNVFVKGYPIKTFENVCAELVRNRTSVERLYKSKIREFNRTDLSNLAELFNLETNRRSADMLEIFNGKAVKVGPQSLSSVFRFSFTPRGSQNFYSTNNLEVCVKGNEAEIVVRTRSHKGSSDYNAKVIYDTLLSLFGVMDVTVVSKNFIPFEKKGYFDGISSTIIVNLGPVPSPMPIMMKSPLDLEFGLENGITELRRKTDEAYCEFQKAQALHAKEYKAKEEELANLKKRQLAEQAELLKEYETNKDKLSKLRQAKAILSEM